MMRVIVANSLVSYREVISAALKDLRPQHEVFVADPGDLDEQLASIFPQLVVCSRVTDLVERDVLAWVELYPDEQATGSVVSLDGKKTTYPDMDFDALLSILDEAERLYESA